MLLADPATSLTITGKIADANEAVGENKAAAETAVEVEAKLRGQVSATGCNY